MPRTIHLSDTVFAMLARAASQRKVSPSALAEKLIAEQIDTEREAWHTAMEKLLARVHERTAGMDPHQIEAEITAAAAEVKADRRGSRRPR
ncbi:MAG: hypothetical protein HY721_28835 [Planctomycetes bacterium]|nr:hypothetical protein [Planctomycetota bacterium]